MTILNLLPYVRDTRWFGHTYVKKAVRSAVGWDGLCGTLDGRTVRATYCGYGRSLENGGHKYKAHLRYEDTGKPVPTRLIDHVQPVSETVAA